jgi:hypothetical protein
MGWRGDIFMMIDYNLLISGNNKVKIEVIAADKLWS